MQTQKRRNKRINNDMTTPMNKFYRFLLGTNPGFLTLGLKPTYLPSLLGYSFLMRFTEKNIDTQY